MHIAKVVSCITIFLLLTACKAPSQNTPAALIITLSASTAVVTTVSPTPRPPAPKINTATPAPTSTPTPQWKIDVVELVPASHREGISKQPLRDVQAVSWVDNEHFVYVFSELNAQQELTLQWVEYDLLTQTETFIPPPKAYNPSFWKRNHLKEPSECPLFQYSRGYFCFSPSGNFVIYHIGYGSPYENESRLELWIAETATSRKFKVGEFENPAIYLSDIDWFDNEQKIIFAGNFEGPGSLYMIDVLSRTVTSLDVATEGGSTLSPDGKTLAVVVFENDGTNNLSLFSVQDHALTLIKRIEPFWIFQFQWSKDGKVLYYDVSDADGHLVEIRAYNIETGSSSVVIDDFSLIEGFRKYERDDVYVASKYYLSSAFAVSPTGDKILFGLNDLYLVKKP